LIRTKSTRAIKSLNTTANKLQPFFECSKYLQNVLEYPHNAELSNQVNNVIRAGNKETPKPIHFKSAPKIIPLKKIVKSDVSQQSPNNSSSTPNKLVSKLFARKSSLRNIHYPNKKLSARFDAKIHNNILLYNNDNTSRYGDLITSRKNVELPMPNRIPTPILKNAVRVLTRVQKLWRAINKMKKLKLEPDELAKGYVFSKEPYDKKYSKELFIAVKTGDYQSVEQYLKKDRYLVYAYDHVNRTALHWAARRGHVKIAELLLKNGADPNATDFLDRNPLHFAVKLNSLDLVRLLILHECDPFQCDKRGAVPLKMSSDQYIQLLLKKAGQVIVLMKWAKYRLRSLLWQRWSQFIMEDPLKETCSKADRVEKLWNYFGCS